MSLLHAEYLKLSRRKLFPVMLGLLAILMGFVGVLFYVILPALPDSAQAGAAVPQRPDAYIYGAVQVAGQAWWFAVILATTMMAAVLVILGNLLADITYSIVDPRISLGDGKPA